MLDTSKESTVGQSFADYFEMMNISEVNIAQDSDDVEIHRNFTSQWGPTRDPLYIVIPITIMYVIIFITGVIGNVSTCVVISRNKSMHTATNYYLFSLAVSDLLLLISGLPPEMYYIWYRYPYIFGEAFCITQGFAAETSANATVLTITAFTIERYVAICHPFLSHTMSKLSRAIKFVIAIWILAMCFAIPQAMSFGIVYERSKDGTMVHYDHYVCAVKRQLIPHAFELSTLVFFVAPMSLISVLYILIALQLRRSKLVKKSTKDTSIELKYRIPKSPGAQSIKGQNNIIITNNSDSPNGGRRSVCGEVKAATSSPPPEDGRKNYHHRNMHSRATKHVVKMLIAVVVAFFICWAPFHAQRLLAIHATAVITPDIIALYTILTYISGILYYLSTCINPLLYNIMSNKFRNAFRETLSRYFGVGNRQRKPVRRYSTLSLPRSLSPTRSQSLSHSGGTSRQASLRYIDGDISRRPLVVSFRRPNASNSYVCIHSAHCKCTRNGDVRRAIYTSSVNQHNNDEEKQNNFKLLKKYAMKNKSSKFKRWGKMNRESYLYGNDSNNSYKVVCSECHRYLSGNHSDKEKKLVLIGGASMIAETVVPQDNVIPCYPDERSCQSCSNDSDNNTLAVVESDLIPRHRCPNQFSDIQEKSETSIESVRSHRQMFSQYLDRSKKCQTLSKTMPNIVNYTNLSKVDFRGHPFNNINHQDTNTSNVEKSINNFNKKREKPDMNIRKWGSAESILNNLK